MCYKNYFAILLKLRIIMLIFFKKDILIQTQLRRNLYNKNYRKAYYRFWWSFFLQIYSTMKNEENYCLLFENPQVFAITWFITITNLMFLTGYRYITYYILLYIWYMMFSLISQPKPEKNFSMFAKMNSRQ